MQTSKIDGESQWTKNAANIKVFIVEKEMLRKKRQKLEKDKKWIKKNQDKQEGRGKEKYKQKIINNAIQSVENWDQVGNFHMLRILFLKIHLI